MIATILPAAQSRVTACGPNRSLSPSFDDRTMLRSCRVGLIALIYARVIAQLRTRSFFIREFIDAEGWVPRRPDCGAQRFWF